MFAFIDKGVATRVPWVHIYWSWTKERGGGERRRGREGGTAREGGGEKEREEVSVLR